MSDIIGSNEFYQEKLKGWLEETLPPTVSYFPWYRCYRAQRDDWTAETFHENCGNRGPSLGLVNVDNKYIFGGFTDQTWQVHGETSK